MAVTRRTRPAAPAPAEVDPALSDNERVRIGGNSPPSEDNARAAFDEVLDKKELADGTPFRDRVRKLIDAASRATATTDDEAGRCGELVKQIRAADKFISDTHVAVKAPYLAAGRAIDAAKNEMVGPLAVARTKVEGMQSAFLRQKQAERDADLRRQREEEDRLRREASERERAAAEAARAKGEPEPEPEPVEPPRQTIVPPEREIIRGDYGAAVSGRREWLSQVEDYELAFMAVAKNEKVREAIDRAIQNLVRGGLHEIDGVKVWSDIKASNR